MWTVRCAVGLACGTVAAVAQVSARRTTMAGAATCCIGPTTHTMTQAAPRQAYVIQCRCDPCSPTAVPRGPMTPPPHRLRTSPHQHTGYEATPAQHRQERSQPPTWVASPHPVSWSCLPHPVSWSCLPVPVFDSTLLLPVPVYDSTLLSPASTTIPPPRRLRGGGSRGLPAARVRLRGVPSGGGSLWVPVCGPSPGAWPQFHG